MSKRRTPPQRPQQFWRTPEEAVGVLAPALEGVRTFAEPCCGDLSLARAVEKLGPRCVYAGDIRRRAPGHRLRDGRLVRRAEMGRAEIIVSNPPWTPRPVLHALIANLSTQLPCWLLLDAGWSHTAQALEFEGVCRRIVSVGRVSWLFNGRNGYEDAAWHLFDARDRGACEFTFRHR